MANEVLVDLDVVPLEKLMTAEILPMPFAADQLAVHSPLARLLVNHVHGA